MPGNRGASLARRDAARLHRVPVGLWLCVALLAACATQQVPPATTFSQTGQHTVLAAQHWGAIAADVALQTRHSLETSKVLGTRSIYVAPFSSSTFDLAFTNFMISSLVKAGIPVTSNPEGALQLKYETQVVYHNVEFDPREQGFIPGLAVAGAATFVAADIWVLHEALDRDSTLLGLVGTIAPGVAYDVVKVRNEPTNTELLITTSITDSEQYVHRTTDAYYIARADAGLFKPSVFKEWKVVPREPN